MSKVREAWRAIPSQDRVELIRAARRGEPTGDAEVRRLACDWAAVLSQPPLWLTIVPVAVVSAVVALVMTAVTSVSPIFQFGVVIVFVAVAGFSMAVSDGTPRQSFG